MTEGKGLQSACHYGRSFLHEAANGILSKVSFDSCGAGPRLLDSGLPSLLAMAK
jgi:hypothetical protein